MIRCDKCKKEIDIGSYFYEVTFIDDLNMHKIKVHYGCLVKVIEDCMIFETRISVCGLIASNVSCRSVEA